MRHAPSHLAPPLWGFLKHDYLRNFLRNMVICVLFQYLVIAKKNQIFEKFPQIFDANQYVLQKPKIRNFIFEKLYFTVIIVF